MHDTLFRAATVLMDGWQNLALAFLLIGRAVARRRTRRLIAAIVAEEEAR